MATNNEVNVGLSGATGTGNFVGSTSPILAAPTLGAALATSINFGQSSLNFYQVGTWTPVDASGASLALTGSGQFTRIGNLIFAYAFVTYPATANTAANAVGGLPFAVPNTTQAQQGFISYSTASTARFVFPNGNTSTLTFLNAGGAQLQNVGLSGSTSIVMVIYPIA